MPHQILITGGAGYIGSILVPTLLSEGHKVTVLDNFMYGQASLNHCAYHSNFSIVRGDVRIAATIQPLLRTADIVIPLAALVGTPLCAQDPVGAKTVNRDAILMMLKLLSKDQYVLMPTTNSAYGHGNADNLCDEESPLNPLSEYAIGKVEVEKRLMEHPNALSFRLATVFGMSPRMRIDLLVNDFTYRAVRDSFIILFEGHFKRNYIHIRDVARAFQHAMGKLDAMAGDIYNIGLSDANLSKFELCERIKSQVPNFVIAEEPISQDPDQRNYIVSNAKIEATGFKPQHSLDQGINELVKGFTMLRNTRYGNL